MIGRFLEGGMVVYESSGWLSSRFFFVQMSYRTSSLVVGVKMALGA